MKTELYLGISLLSLIGCNQAFAQEPALAANAPNAAQAPAAAQADHAVVQINQPFVSKVFGELTLPFMWEVTQDEKNKRLTAIETRTERPAKLTIDIMATPKGLDEEQIARQMMASAAESLGTTATIETKTEKLECGKSKCPELTFIRTAFEGTENSIPRKCAMEIVPSSKQVAVLSLCAHAERTYEPSLDVIVHQVFKMMK